MQFIVNLFGTVVANKDVATKGSTTGLRILDEKVRILSNHVDFLLQSHFSQQTVTLKTCDEYTSENGGEAEDCESGRDDASSTSAGEEEDGRGDQAEEHADVPAGDSQEGRVDSSAGQAGEGSGQAAAGQGGQNSADSH